MKQLFKFVLLFFFLLLTSVSLHATIFVEGGISSSSGRQNVQDIIPQGQRGGVSAIKIRSNDTDNDELDSITIEVLSTLRWGTGGITSVEVYRDANGDGRFTAALTSSAEEDVRIGEPFVFQSQQSLTQVLDGLSESVPSTSTTYFVVFRLSEAVPPGATANVEIKAINGDAVIISSSGFDFSNQFSVSGLEVIATPLAPSIVVPGQNLENESGPINMLQLAIESTGELVNSEIAIRIENSEGNFVTDNTKEDGITKVYLYRLESSILPDPQNFNPTLIVSEISGDQFVSNTEAYFYFPSSSDQDGETSDNKSGIALNNGATSNFIVMYDIGDKFLIDEDTSIKAEMTIVTGNGFTSNLPLVHDDNQPVATAEVAGIRHTGLNDIVPDATFGDESTIPMLEFAVQSIHAAFDLTKITIENPSSNTVPFVTDSSPEDIQRVEIYEDLGPNNRPNGTFDGVDSFDRRVGNVELGTGLGFGNESDLAPIPVEISVSSTVTESLTISTYNSSLGYPDNNEKRFFVVYYTGTNILANGTASARIHSGEGRTLFEGVTHNVTLSGTLPAAASPDALVEFEDTSVYILDMDDISPTFAVKGQIKVPMLRIQLHADSAVSSASITFKNNELSFTSESNGATKVWLYRDDAPFQDTFDPRSGQNPDVTLIAANGNIDNTETATISGIPLVTGDDNHFFVLYDVGALSSSDMAAQMNSILSEQSIVFGGQLPNPVSAASITPTSARLKITDVTTDQAVIGSAVGTFNVTVVVKNVHSEDVVVSDVEPRFYLTDISGQDISFEFDSELEAGQTIPFTIAAGQSEVFRFDVSHARKFSQGAAILDGYVKYIVTDPHQAIVSRYENSSTWFSAAANETTLDSTADALSLQGVEDTFDWTLPAYIDSIQSRSGAITKTFANQSVVPPNSSLVIQFANQGQVIDESSLQVQLNGSVLTRATTVGSSSTRIAGQSRVQAQSTDFTYVSETDVGGQLQPVGTLTISDVGSPESGEVIITASDPDGNTLTTATIGFSAQVDLALTEPLFYPNPFRFGSENLKLGFNIAGNEPAVIDVYFYNHLGMQVHKFTQDFSSGELASDSEAGYKIIEFSGFSSFLKSGHYVVRIVAESGGRRVFATTKLAVY